MPEQDIEAVRRRHVDELMRLPNVTGVAIGERNGRPIIQVLVVRKIPLAKLRREEVVPKTLEGWETDVVEIGVVSTH